MKINSALMKKINTRYIFSIIFFFLLTAIINAQNSEINNEESGNGENCTTIMVGMLASTDGSVMTSHSCDGNYRTWLEIYPHQKFDPGAMHQVYSGMLHTEEAWDMTNVVLKGEIPEVSETYSFLNTAYPCLNEKQLAIGETTIYGRQELANANGMFMIEELESDVDAELISVMTGFMRSVA